MKKTTRRLFAFLIATVIAFSVCVPALAASNEGPTINPSRTFYSWEELQNDPSVTIEQESGAATFSLLGEPYKTSLNLGWEGSTVGATRYYSGNVLYSTFNGWDSSYNEGAFGTLYSSVGTRGILGFTAIESKETTLSRQLAPNFTLRFTKAGSGSRAFGFSMSGGDFHCDDVILGSN